MMRIFIIQKQCKTPLFTFGGNDYCTIGEPIKSHEVFMSTANVPINKGFDTFFPFTGRMLYYIDFNRRSKVEIDTFRFFFEVIN